MVSRMNYMLQNYMHTVLVYLFPDLPKVTYISGNKELKSTKVTARGQNIFSGYQGVLFWDLFSLTYLCVTCLQYLMKLVLQTRGTTIHLKCCEVRPQKL